jgi:cation/acetate symporter
VQFLKGSLLVAFSAALSVMILNRGLSVPDDEELARVTQQQTITDKPDGTRLVNGQPDGELARIGHVSRLPGGEESTGPLGPLEFIRVLGDSEVVLWSSQTAREPDGTVTTTYTPKATPGNQILRPGNLPQFRGIRGEALTNKLDFVSLMLALFCGTASLPHILIRYYTVPDAIAARKSTIVGIGSIGFFYVLTLYLGLGAMTSGALDVTDSNMAAPLLARSFSDWLFAVISAIAFTTVLGTVSGLIIAASGAVVHDLLTSVLKIDLGDYGKVRVARIASVAVGAVAIVLGILFEKMNVNYLVGWAFSIAASANLPALVMLLFWKGTTRAGITAAILVGMTSSLAWILAGADTYKNVYGLPPEEALVPLSQPGIVTIPLGFATLVVVSLLTREANSTSAATR